MCFFLYTYMNEFNGFHFCNAYNCSLELSLCSTVFLLFTGWQKIYLSTLYFLLHVITSSFPINYYGFLMRFQQYYKTFLSNSNTVFSVKFIDLYTNMYIFLSELLSNKCYTCCFQVIHTSESKTFILHL